MAAPVVVVVPTLGIVSGVAAPNYVCEEGASVAGTVMVRALSATVAPAAELGSGVESLPSWAAPATES
jgi:hypothetical protein